MSDAAEIMAPKPAPWEAIEDGEYVATPRPPRMPVYVAEKLFNETRPSETSIALTELLNGVIAVLAGGA